MKRSGAPKRKAPLRRRGKSRFPKRRNDAYRKWIRRFPCVSWRVGCIGPIECAHVKSRGAGGDDIGNCIPLCRHHHREQHDHGWGDRPGILLVSAAAIARELAYRWREQQGETAA